MIKIGDLLKRPPVVIGVDVTLEEAAARITQALWLNDYVERCGKSRGQENHGRGTTPTAKLNDDLYQIRHLIDDTGKAYYR